MFYIDSMPLDNPKGFSIKFENGYTLSIQFGVGNYCSNRWKDWEEPTLSSKTAETAIIEPSGEFHEYKGDDVQGWQSPDEVAETITYIQSL